MTGGSGDDDAPLVDPMADVLFGAASLLVLVLLVLMPVVGRSEADARGAPDRTPAPAGSPDPRLGDLVYAGADGLRYGAEAATVALDRIPDDRGFALWLSDRRRAGTDVGLVVGVDGGEAAFVVEPVIARAGIGTVAVRRLARACPSGGEPARFAACVGVGGAAR